MKRLMLVVLCLVIGTISYKIATREKVVGETIVLGQSIALSGASSHTGQALKDGANAYFRYINDKGGIYNRKIKLISLDDLYEPEYAQKNTLELVTKQNVFALFGEFGTPTSKMALPIAKQYNVPFLFPFSGAEFLRTNDASLVVNLRRSYFDETEALIEYVTTKQKAKKIAILYQNDSYGKVGLQAVENSLEKRGLSLVAKGTFRRNTFSYRNALKTIKNANPDVVMLFGTYKPISSFIKNARKEGLKNTIFCNISFGGSSSIIKRLDGEMENIIFSQVIPTPFDVSINVVKEYQEILSNYYPHRSYDFVSLEGFLAAKLVVEAIKEAGEKLTRSEFMDAFNRLNKNVLEGLEIGFSPLDNEALNEVYIMDFHNGSFRLLEKIRVK